MTKKKQARFTNPYRARAIAEDGTELGSWAIEAADREEAMAMAKARFRNVRAEKILVTDETGNTSPA